MTYASAKSLKSTILKSLSFKDFDIYEDSEKFNLQPNVYIATDEIFLFVSEDTIVDDKAIYFRTIPGHGKLRGVHRIGNQNLEPEIKIKILDYNEPTHVPFESWGTSMMNLPENFDLAKLLDPEDEYSDTTALSDTETAAIEDRTDDENVQHYIDRENEIIGMLVSLQNLMKNDDGGMMHLMKDRDFEEDASQIDGMLVDAEKSTMDLYNLKSANRARVQEQRKKGRKSVSQEVASSSPDLAVFLLFFFPLSCVVCLGSISFQPDNPDRHDHVLFVWKAAVGRSNQRRRQP